VTLLPRRSIGALFGLLLYVLVGLIEDLCPHKAILLPEAVLGDTGALKSYDAVRNDSIYSLNLCACIQMYLIALFPRTASGRRMAL
jgi:hypothetical protein